MDEVTENADSLNGETSDTDIAAADTSGMDAATLQAKLTETEQKNRQLFERAKKAEGFVLKDGHWMKAEKPASKQEGGAGTQSEAGELNETQLDYLDVKGVTESDDLDVIAKVMKRTGQTVRQALQDEYVQDKLKANQQKRIVQNATPSGTKRSGSGVSDNFDAAVAKFETTGELPSDYDLRTKVVNAVSSKNDISLPPWQRR